MKIAQFPKLDAQHFDPRRVAILGQNSFTAREDDDLTVRAVLSEPVYTYLIAFSPDGTEEICDPDDADRPPARTQQPQYPPAAKSDERFRLSEGAGLCAFALVVSRSPLPSYREWKRRHGPMPWAARLPHDPAVDWLDEGQSPQALLADNPAGVPGKDVKAPRSGGPVAELARWIRGLPGVDAVTLIAFPVEPASVP